MDVIRGDGKILEDINLAPRNVYEEVAQNIAVILANVQNSCPMLRNIGIPGDVYARPTPVAESLIVGYVYDQIEEFEPRAVIGDVTVESDGIGRAIPIVELEGVDEEDE